jgi:hypothetical protein
MIPRSETGLWRWHFGALAVYAALALAIIGHGVSLTQNILGIGADPFAFIWFLGWWPWAIAHHLNPLFTNLVWQPSGVQLTWVTSVPLLAILGMPFTLLYGPVVTFNVLILCGPVLAAWVAYRLCLKLTGVPEASLVGGYLFGFSSYEMGQDLAALNLNFTMFVPALMLIILLRLDNEISRTKTVFLAATVLVCQFLNCIEIFALICVFGGIAWLLAFGYLPMRRPDLRRLFVDGLFTAPLVVVAVSPFLLAMFSHAGFVHLPAEWPYYFTADLLNIVVPTRLDAIGGSWFTGISGNFKGGISEEDAYLGLPLLLIIVLFARDNKNLPAARFPLALFLVLVIASFGPQLWIDGKFSRIMLPWRIAMNVPLISSALPCRFALFSSLVAAIIAALWIAQAPPGRSRRLRFDAGLLACFVLLPAKHQVIKPPHSAFFQPGRVEAVLGPDPRLLILPFAISGPSSFWQQESGYSFAQTGGYLGFPPASMQHYAAVGQLFGNYQGPGFVNDFKVFCSATQTQYVVAGPGTSAAMLAALVQLNWPVQKIDDVTIFTVPGTGMDGPAHG